MAKEDTEVLEKLIEIDKHLNYLDSRISTLEENQGTKHSTSSAVSQTESREEIVTKNIQNYVNENPHVSAQKKREALLGSGYTNKEIDNVLGQNQSSAQSNSLPWANDGKGTGYSNKSTPRDFTKEGGSNESFEVQLGTKWFSRIGITALVIGVALFLMYLLPSFNALGKISLGILSAAALMGGGFYLEKKYQLYGQILFGGGVALMYFTTYASFYFVSSKVIDSQELCLAMLVIISSLYLVYSLRYKSQTMTGIALLLVYLTTNLGTLGDLSLIMLTGVLTIAIGIAAWKKWNFLFFASLFASYLTFARWIFMNGSAVSLEYGAFVFAVSIITFCYLLYVLGTYFIYKDDNKGKNIEPVVFILINTFLYFSQVLGLYYMLYDDKKGFIWLAFAIFNVLLAVVSRFGAKMTYSARAYLAVATLSLLIFIPICFTGYGAYIAWLALGLTFVGYGIYKGTIRTRAIGLAIMLLAFVRLFVLNFGVVPVEQNLLFFSIFCICTEGISIAMVNTNLKSDENDNPQNDSALQGIYSIISVISLAVMLYYVVDPNYLTLSWGVAGFLVPILGFGLNDKYLRRAGLGLLMLTIVKLFLVDLANMATEFKILSFIGLGVVLLIISFGYTKYKDEIGKYL